MDPLFLARLQFTIVTVYHFFFVPLTLGLSIFVALNGKLIFLFWIPTAAALMSLTGRCPGTIVISRLFPDFSEDRSKNSQENV